MADLIQVPGDPEVWRVGSQTFLVYMVPGTESDPVHMAWEVSTQSALQSMFGPGQDIVYDREISEAMYASAGVLEFGDANELANLADEPFITWANDMEMLAQTQPWVLDSDYQTLVAMAILEDRLLTESEVATTNWWKNHTSAQRAWMAALHGDPATAEQLMADANRDMRNRLTSAGAGADPDPEVVAFMANQWLTGTWSEIELQDQIRAVTDPYSPVGLHPELAALIDTEGALRQTTDAEDTVRSLLNTWLGPSYGNWSNTQIAEAAGRIRNDPEAEQRFVEELKDQRMVILPQYENREISYQSIANTWRQWWIGQWGQDPDETEDFWLDVIRTNDAGEAGVMMRREGLNRGVKTVTDRANAAALQNTTGLRRPTR